MQQSYDLFNKLDMVRATSVIKASARATLNKALALECEVKEHLADGDEVLFQIDSINFWLCVNFNLFTDRGDKPLMEGSIEIRVDKAEKMQNIKKKLQILLIKIWYHSNEKKADTYYVIDEFTINSLYPPVSADDLTTEPSHNSLEVHY